MYFGYHLNIKLKIEINKRKLIYFSKQQILQYKCTFRVLFSTTTRISYKFHINYIRSYCTNL